MTSSTTRALPRSAALPAAAALDDALGVGVRLKAPDAPEPGVAERAEELRIAVRARERTLAVVSHDLRNPLGTIEVSAALSMSQLASDPRWPTSRWLSPR